MGGSCVKIQGYKEAQVENDFIKPFFGYLNWNVSNIGLSPEKQVFQLQVTGKTGKDNNKRPDYLLRFPDKNTNSMKSAFFIEAKKPIYDLKTKESYIRQVYKYAWSSQNSSDSPNNHVRLALLTDFEEFRFFDCQDATPLKQNRAEGFNKHIVKDWTYKDYISKFDELWDMFEYNNVVNGSLSQWYLTSKQLADNRITPDKIFLEDLRKWRLEIARSMHKNDLKLEDYRLTKATLLYINRIIFVKMLADRNIEEDYLSNIIDKLDKSKKSELKLFELCKDIFARLDNIYNGSIFAYDVDTDEINIDNSVLKSIFTSLKPENSIYTLAAMPVEIIGNVYELLIAEQIAKKGKGLAIVSRYDEKKAGGVYYTPRYIVEYIVDNTLEKKLEKCKNPEDVAKIKVLDPACGSGSFLIVAYQKLLDWHKKYYFNELSNWTKKDSIEKFRNKFDNKIRVINNELNNFDTIHLSHKLKSDILTNNIYGVDIDSQAVMVTKFSLSMKALEDSTHDEVIEDNTLFKMPAIPKLENNIKCGNSLIGSDFYNDNRPSLFNEKEKRKINTFDWEKEFPSIFNVKEDEIKADISIKIDSHLNEASKYIDGAVYHAEKTFQYLEVLDKYSVNENSLEYKSDSKVINKGGFDVIIGNPPYVRIHLLDPSVIEYFLKNYKIASGQIDLYSLFIEKSISILSNHGKFGFIVPRFIQFNLDSELLRKFILNYHIDSLTEVGKSFENVNTECLVIVINKNSEFLNSHIFDYYPNDNLTFVKSINQEIFKLYPNNIFNTIIRDEEFKIIIKMNHFPKLDTLFSIRRGMEIGKNEIREFKSGYKTLLGMDVIRYSICHNNTFIPKNFNEAIRLQPFSNVEKLLVRRVAKNLICVYDNDKYHFNKNLYSIINKVGNYNLKYLLALLNSKLLNFYLKKYFTTKKEEIFPEIQSYQIKNLPIKPIDFTIRSEKAKHDKLVDLVDQMLENKKYQHEATTESDKKLYSNICDNLDKQIDKIVYELYELNEEEIKVVEG